MVALLSSVGFSTRSAQDDELSFEDGAMSVPHILMALSVPLIWGMGFVFAKAALEFFPPILLMAFRFTVTALVLVWFVKPPVPLFRQIALIALISAAVQYSLTFTGLRDIDASTAILVVQLEVPFMILLGAIVLGERPSLRKYLGIALAFAGVVLIAGEPHLKGSYVPMALVIGGAFFWAVGQVMVRRLGDVGGFTLIAWVAVMATPQLFIASAIFESNQLELIRTANWIVWGTVVYLGLVMTALGYTLWYHLLGKYEVNQVGPFLLLLPVFTVAAGAIFLGEQMTLIALLGGTIVIAGVAFITIERLPKWLTAEI